jgi:hypothetical protein
MATTVKEWPCVFFRWSSWHWPFYSLWMWTSLKPRCTPLVLLIASWRVGLVCFPVFSPPPNKFVTLVLGLCWRFQSASQGFEAWPGEHQDRGSPSVICWTCTLA